MKRDEIVLSLHMPKTVQQDGLRLSSLCFHVCMANVVRQANVIKQNSNRIESEINVHYANSELELSVCVCGGG